MQRSVLSGLVLLALCITNFPSAQAVGDSAAGKRRAAVCFSCHGENGVSIVPGTPHLAGQDEAYLRAALLAYRSGIERNHVTMTAMARPLSERDIKDIAAYYTRQGASAPGETSCLAREALRERLQPAGEVCVAPTPATAPDLVTAGSTAATRPGQQVYDSYCAACHATGVAEAPLRGAAEAWQPRLARGQAALLQSALDGLKLMPPRGGCSNCSSEELQQAIEYMLP